MPLHEDGCMIELHHEITRIQVPYRTASASRSPPSSTGSSASTIRRRTRRWSSAPGRRVPDRHPEKVTPSVGYVLLPPLPAMSGHGARTLMMERGAQRWRSSKVVRSFPARDGPGCAAAALSELSSSSSGSGA